ncbi:chymotrypsin-2-like [Drosophila obscura]|uniref:chymotrypsin-2-like n=1 Tax=Drosophila obscura TaxID=7282 RepID=UPI001BB2145B|nr:chymotrypsin-2-like [Drosophila obscura]
MIGATSTRRWLWLWPLLVCLAAQGISARQGHGWKRYVSSLNNSAEEEDGIGDVVAPRNLSPWQVSIQNAKRRHKCSGAILAKDWVVTTANCMRGFKVKGSRMVVGTQILGTSNKHSYKIEYVIAHPHFDKPKKANDIALIYTHTSIKFSWKIKAIPVLGAPLPRDTLVLHTGWSWRKGVDANKMRTVYHRVIPYKICLSYFNQRVRNPIAPGHLCLNLPKDSDYCLRESGGLLVHKNKLAGLSSFGATCANGDPFVGTRISFYFDFIRTTMEGCSRCTPEYSFEARFFDL